MPRSAIEWIDSESSDAEPVQIQPANLMPATPELPTIAAKTARDPTLMWPTGVRAGSEKAPRRRARSCVGVRPLAAGRAAAASAPAAASSPIACRARHAEGQHTASSYDTASSYATCPAWLGCNSASSRLRLAPVPLCAPLLQRRLEELRGAPLAQGGVLRAEDPRSPRSPR